MFHNHDVSIALTWKKYAMVLVSVMVAASLILAACGGAQTQTTEPQPVTTEAQPAVTEAQPAVTEAQPVATEAPPATTEEAGKKVVTIIYSQEFDNLSPLYSDMWFVWTTWQLVNSWAWEFDEKNEPFPKLVTEIPSPENGGISADGSVITMTLRNDIKWSDNEPITAKDFIFTYEMAVSDNNAVTSKYPYDKIDTMTSPDPQTVVIKFKEPFAPWLATLWHGILPEHLLRPIYDQDGTLDNSDWKLKPSISAGPYLLAEWESGSFARFVRNDNYWGPKPKIDEIFIRFVPESAAQTKALEAGDADLGTFVPYSDVPALKQAGIGIVIEPSGYNEGLYFLVSKEKGNPALLDVNVRKAIALAIDRDKLNQDLHLGLTKTPTSYWDALPFYNNPPLTPYPFDPEEAKKLLDQAGWVDSNGDGVRDKDGVELILKYGTTIREDRQDTQAVIQQELATVGIKADIQSYDGDIFLASYADGGPAAKGEVDIQEWSDGPVWPDADIYYWLCSEIPSDTNPQGSNWFYLCDEELDSLIQLQSTQVDVNERQKTISKINQLFYDKVYWIGLWQDPDVWAVGPKLINVKFSGVTPYFNVTDWDIK
jgi:peptide/nickel transport system substrate-binding protein